jgi:hypothetical protein
MKMTNWKTIAIIFIVLFTLETAFMVWAVYISVREEQRTNDCYYNFCGNYPDALYYDGICECYEYDVMGNPVIAKTKYGG